MASDVAIRVEGLGKMYRIGRKREWEPTWAGRIGQSVAMPFAWLASQVRGPSAEEALWALRNITFEVKHGEVLGVIGGNGAGKSTLLKVLSRITDPTEGYADIFGRVGSLLEVGTGMHPELTGRENIFVNGCVLGMRRREIERKFADIVDFAGVSRFIDTPVKRYSSGMHVRLGFAIAAHLEPEILLVDEVLSVGDAEFQRRCLGKMSEVAGEGRTVLFVSHNLAAVQNTCRRCLLLDSGHIVRDGETEAVVMEYLQPLAGQGRGCVDLTEHRGRVRGAPVILRSIGLLGGDGASPYMDTVATGTDAVFEIAYDCGERQLDYAALAISSALGERILTVGTHLCPTSPVTFTGRGTVCCRLPRLPLAAGEYSVLVALGNGSPTVNADCVEDAMRFRVQAGNHFGTGKTLLPGQGYLAQVCEWYEANAPCAGVGS
jgi:lipopolysaccharide transport system ATP-binding protein